MDWMEIMSNVEQLKTEVKTQILNAIKHPYLKKHLLPPTIDEVKVTILIELMDQHNFTKEKILHYCKALMIHQIALDTHELVSTYEGTPQDREKKQLTVLEGDFYSGLYYEALSNTGEISLIRELSYAVKEMNEQKINLVHHKFTSLEELLRCITVIESTILVHFANYIGSNQSIKNIENKCLMTRLEQEIQHVKDGEDSDFLKHLGSLQGIETEKNELLDVISKIILQLQN